MSKEFKDIDKKPHVLLFYDIIDIKKFDANKTNMYKKSQKNISIDCFGM